MNTSGAASVAAASSLLFSSLLFSSLLALSGRATAQAKIHGSWLAGFDHEHGYVNGAYVPGSNATDFMAAFPSGSFVTVPLPPPATGTIGDIGEVLGWGDWQNQTSGQRGKFNAIHMALIPKGPHRGKVIVWNKYPVVIQPGPPYAPTTKWWYCQAWSIVDPRPTAPSPRFRNYLLPIGEWTGVSNATPHGTFDPDPIVTLTNPPYVFETKGIFCSGHAWSQEGDLIVAGGDRFVMSGPVFGLYADNGTNFMFLLDLSRPSAVDSLLTNTALYSGPLDVGRWQQPQGHQLQMDRWYPTVLLTHRLSRTAPDHTAMVAGGTNHDPAVPVVPTNPNALNDPRQTYESFRVRQSTAATYLQRDVLPSGHSIFFGPLRSAPLIDVDWMHEYPRLHLLGDGKVFLSGYSPTSARLDPEVPPIVNGPLPRWDFAIGNTGAQWPGLRHDGSAVHFARVGPFQNLVVRLHGSDGVGGPCTETVEYCPAASVAVPPAGWIPLAPTSQQKVFPNAVVLPDSSIFVVGGTDQAATPHLNWLRFTLQTGWTESSPLPTARGYHSTAVLLPDGRVLVGGGEGRHNLGFGAPSPHDYDVYEPPYLHNGQARPTGLDLPLLTLQPDGFHLDVESVDHRLVCNPLPGMDTLAKVVLTAPGSITHHSDMSARYVELPTREPSNNQIVFDVPDERLVPRGYYMLWAVTSGGTPSEAMWVKIQ